MALLVLLVGVFTAGACGEPAAGSGRLFLRTIETGVWPAGVADRDVPRLTAGRLVAPAPRGVAGGVLTEAMAKGTLEIGPPRAGPELTIAVVSPVLDSGDYWEATALACSGQDLTLVVEHWADDGRRLKNIRHRTMQFLGTNLPGGGPFTLRLAVVELFRDMKRVDSLYVLTGGREGSTQLAVAVEKAEGSAAVIRAADLTAELQPGADGNRARQHGLVNAAEVELIREVPGVRVGTFDLAAWQTRDRGGPTVPKLTPPTGLDPIYAVVVGPEVNSGEFLTPGQIVWDGKRCEITVELWRDAGVRLQNSRRTPVLVIPLNPPGRQRQVPWAAGDYKVTLKWNDLHAPSAGGVYAAKAEGWALPGAVNEVGFTVKP